MASYVGRLRKSLPTIASLDGSNKSKRSLVTPECGDTEHTVNDLKYFGLFEKIEKV